MLQQAGATPQALITQTVRALLAAEDYHQVVVRVEHRPDLDAFRVRVDIEGKQEIFFIYSEQLIGASLGAVIESRLEALVAALNAKFLAPEFDNTTG